MKFLCSNVTAAKYKSAKKFRTEITIFKRPVHLTIKILSASEMSAANCITSSDVFKEGILSRLLINSGTPSWLMHSRTVP